MNGLELQERIQTLTYELEKYPKLALANVLAVNVLVQAYGGETPEESVNAAAEALHDALRKARSTASLVYATRRVDRIMKEFANPKPKRKRRRKKRRTKRGL